MLMLGESVLSLLISTVVEEDFGYYRSFYTGILSVTLLQFLYFKSQPNGGHVVRNDRVSGTLFAVLLQTLSAALVTIGVGYKMLLREYTLEHGSTSHRLLSGNDNEILKYTQEERRER